MPNVPPSVTHFGAIGLALAHVNWHHKPGLLISLGGALILVLGVYIAVTAPNIAPLREGSS